jgi:hypothetical protein
MKNYFTEEQLASLKKLIGTTIDCIYLEGGTLCYGDGVIWDGNGKLCLLVSQEKQGRKVRLRFFQETDGPFNLEFLEWEEPIAFKKRYDPYTGKVSYDFTPDENLRIFHANIRLTPKPGEDVHLYNRIKSIKIYHLYSDYEDEYKLDFIAFIDIETETGRRIVLEQDDPIDSFYIHLDSLDRLNYMLEEVYDIEGPGFGEKLIQLRHHIC